MRWVSGLWVIGVLVMAAHARADEPSPCTPPANAAELRADERRFEVALERFEKLWELTQSLVNDRERHAFEDAMDRYERFAALTRELSLKHAAEEEQAFEQSVSLYLRKRELTDWLARVHGRAP